MAGWMSIDPKVRSHLGKSLALSLLIAGVWPMAALAEEISAALPQATEPLGDIGTDPAPLEAPPSAEPEITAAYISPPSDFQLTLDSADTVPEHSLSPVPQDESITQHPEASLAAALEADQHPQPSPKDLTDQPVIEQLPPTIDTKPPITASPPRTLAEAGWTTAPQVIAINQGTTPSNSAAVTSQPLVQAEPDVPTDTTTGEQSDTPPAQKQTLPPT